MIMASENSATEVFSSAVASRVHKNENEIIQWLSPNELVPHMCKCGLMDLQEVGEFILNSSTTRREKAEHILSVLKSKGPSAYFQFLECLKQETNHLGHAYIASLLEGKKFGDEGEVQASYTLQKCITECMTDLVKYVDVQALAPLLQQNLLLTNSEQEILMNYKMQNEQVFYLLSVIGTKGPTAYYKFTCCLGDESEHCAHWELFETITSHKDCASFKLHLRQRKRKAEEDEDTVVPKRNPHHLEAHGTLVSRKYFEYMRKIRRCHLTGKWSEADKIVKECMLTDDKVLHIAVMLEDCTGYITRCEKDTVLTIVEKAEKMCYSELPSTSNNWFFLKGRCEWVLAKLYRYTKEKDKALQHILKAMECQYNVARGEDTALTNYCHACILLESLADSYSEENSRKAKASLECAIYYASNKEYGLDLSHPRIRLAQLYLGSSPSQPGRNQDPDSINKARDSLLAVEFDALAVRTKCIFYFTKSDLLYNCSKIDKARQFAQLALDIATENNFKTEVASAQARLESFTSQTD